jgi:hypothetical protein
MTSNTEPAPYVAASSSVYSTEKASHLFDGKPDTLWHSTFVAHTGYNKNDAATDGHYSGTNGLAVDGATVEGEWVTLDFGSERGITSYTIDPRLDTYNGGNHYSKGLPKAWKLLSSDDGAAWKEIDAQHLAPDSFGRDGLGDVTKSHTFTLSTLSETRYVGLVITRVFTEVNWPGTGTHYASFAGLRFA